MSRSRDIAAIMGATEAVNTANASLGAGGASAWAVAGEAGGSGVVIIRYKENV